MDDLTPCPFCTSTNVELHYARVEGGTQPGCLNCEQSRPLAEWMRMVREATT